MLAAQNYSKKIHNFFEKCHLGVCSVHAIFADCVLPDYALFFPLCNNLFHFCHTETSYIATLHDALRVFFGPYSASEDGVASNNRHLFSVQLLLKFGKVGVLSLELYEKVVTSDFDSLMDNKEKKTAGNFAAQDNAVLIRYRVQRFHKQQRSNSKQTNKGNKIRRNPALLSKSPAKRSPPAQAAKLPVDTPPAPLKVSPPGFLNLLHTQAERKLPPSSTTRKLGLLKFACSGRGSDMQNSTLPLNPQRPVVDSEMAIEADLGPFELASPAMVRGLSLPSLSVN